MFQLSSLFTTFMLRWFYSPPDTSELINSLMQFSSLQLFYRLLSRLDPSKGKTPLSVVKPQRSKSVSRVINQAVVKNEKRKKLYSQASNSFSMSMKSDRILPLTLMIVNRCSQKMSSFRRVFFFFKSYFGTSVV